MKQVTILIFVALFPLSSLKAGWFNCVKFTSYFSKTEKDWDIPQWESTRGWGGGSRWSVLFYRHSERSDGIGSIGIHGWGYVERIQDAMPSSLYEEIKDGLEKYPGRFTAMYEKDQADRVLVSSGLYAYIDGAWKYRSLKLIFKKNGKVTFSLKGEDKALIKAVNSQLSSLPWVENGKVWNKGKVFHFQWSDFPKFLDSLDDLDLSFTKQIPDSDWTLEGRGISEKRLRYDPNLSEPLHRHEDIRHAMSMQEVFPPVVYRDVSSTLEKYPHHFRSSQVRGFFDQVRLEFVITHKRMSKGSDVMVDFERDGSVIIHHIAEDDSLFSIVDKEIGVTSWMRTKKFSPHGYDKRYEYRLKWKDFAKLIEALEERGYNLVDLSQ